MNLTDPGREGQLVSVGFDIAAFEMRVDYFKGPGYKEHVGYKEGFSRYQCFKGIEKAPRGPFNPYLLPFENASGDGQKIGVRVGREFYDRLPFRAIQGAKCTYSVRPGFEGVPVSKDQLLGLSVVKEFSPECPARMVDGRLVIDEVSEAAPDVPESAVESEPVPAPVSDLEAVKAVARVKAVVPGPAAKHPPVGRKLKLAYIPGEMFDLGSFDGLCLGEIETYRIVRTFAKQAGRGSKFYYNQVGILQLCGLLEIRKADMLVRKKDEKRREVEKIRISNRSVRRYIKGLRKRGLLIRVAKGRQSSPEFGPGYVSKYQVAMSEPQRFKMAIKRKKRRGGKRPYARLFRGLVPIP
ncbi:hypothetical protein ES705_27646 [subsurface metagenome]